VGKLQVKSVVVEFLVICEKHGAEEAKAERAKMKIGIELRHFE
jgi:hypothetical protein